VLPDAAQLSPAGPCRPDQLPGRTCRARRRRCARHGPARGGGGDRPRPGARHAHRPARHLRHAYRLEVTPVVRLVAPPSSLCRTPSSGGGVRGAARVHSRSREPPAPQPALRRQDPVFPRVPLRDYYIWGATPACSSISPTCWERCVAVMSPRLPGRSVLPLFALLPRGLCKTYDDRCAAGAPGRHRRCSAIVRAWVMPAQPASLYMGTIDRRVTDHAHSGIGRRQ